MEKIKRNKTLSQLKRELVSIKSTFTSFEQLMKSNLNTFEQSFNEVIHDYNTICDEHDSLLAENESLLKENQTLNLEIESVNTDKEIYRTELIETRNENDSLIKQLAQRELVHQKALEFAKNMLMGTNPNGLQPVVNSLPSFSEQMVIMDRPSSMIAFGSVAQMEEMRLAQSKEDKVSNSKQNSTETTTSDLTFYDATSNRSSITNGCASVRPKVCQQNQVSSTINSCDKLDESQLNGSVSTKSHTFDESGSLRLKLVKVNTNKMTPVTIAYIETPSSFWLHLNDREVNNYFHVIQVKQEEMEKSGNYKLTSADITLGMYCAAVYSSDGYWYRAQIIHINYENAIEKDSIKTVKVLFVDWGNTEELPLSKIMRLSVDLTKRKQAIHCYLQGMGLETFKWPKKSVDEFKDAIDNQNLSAIFLKPHKLNEVLDSVIYPVDLIIRCENGQTENLVNYLPLPDVDAEEETDLIQLNEMVGVATPETLVSDTKPVPKQNINGSQKSEIKLKSCRGTNSESFSDPNFMAKCNERADVPQIAARSVPLNVSECVPQSLSQSNIISYVNEIRIPPPIVPDNNEGLIVLPSHIISPSEFFVHINDTQVGIAQLEDLDEQLFNYYSNYEPVHETDVSQVTAKSFWACQYSQDQRWYRVRVITVIDDKALVSYVDYGNEELVEIKDLMPLTRQFATCPALAVKCCLSRVSPNGSNAWSEESIQYFTELTGYQDEHILTAYIGHKPSNFSFDSRLEIFLWTNDSNGPNAKDILINSNLVIQKYAITDNMEWVEEAERADREKTPPEVTSQLISKIAYRKRQVNGCSTSSAQNRFRCLPELTPNSSEEDDDWDPMVDDAHCDINNYQMIPDDPATATLGFHPKDRRTCKYYGTPGGCRASNYCTFLHVDPERRHAVEDEEEEVFGTCDLDLEIGSSVILKVTGIQSPFSFFGILPFGNRQFSENDIKKACNNEAIGTLNQFQQLKDLCSALKVHYSNTKAKENPNVFHAIGSLVAYKDEKLDTYFRGRLIKTDFESNCCTIFNVDLGHTVNVKRVLVFKLERYFAQLPTLAIQCSLYGVEPLNTNCRQTAIWSEQAIKAFTDWTLDRVFCAHILSGKLDNKISLELIDYSNGIKEYISGRMIEYKFAQQANNNFLENQPNKQSDDEIYASDLD